VKRIAFAWVAPAAISGTKAVGQALTLPRTTRSRSSTYSISRLAGFATILSSLTFLLFYCSPALAQSQPLDQLPRKSNLPDAPVPSLRSAPQPQQQTYGTVSGRVVDQTGTGVAGANVKLMCDQGSVIQEAQSDDDGQFTFARVSPGALQLTIAAQGFATQMISGTLLSGEDYVFP